jgi:hypothetical protein
MAYTGDRGRYNFSEVVLEDYLKIADLPPRVFGEIYEKDNETPVELDVGAFVQINHFTANGVSDNCTPVFAEGHILITTAGIYVLNCYISLSNGEAGAQTVEVALFVNNGTEELINTSCHRKLAGGTGDTGSMSLGGIVELDVGDTLELWAVTDGTAQDVVFEDVTLSIIGMGTSS